MKIKKVCKVRGVKKIYIKEKNRFTLNYNKNKI